jgi:exosortase A-associated hydrolase 2
MGIIYCHPFAEEKNMSHSVVVKSTRMFAKAGYHVFRFDFSGCGDSEGDLSHSTVHAWLQDLNEAIKVFKKETGITQYFLWGLRMGAGLAMIHAHNSNDVAGLILWQPFLDFSVHIKQFMRRAISSLITNQGAMDKAVEVQNKGEHSGNSYIIGYPISQKLIDSFESIGNQPEKYTPNVPVLILSISPMDQPSRSLKSFAEHLINGGTKITLEHATTDPFWDRYWQWECKKAEELTLLWLKDRC